MALIAGALYVWLNTESATVALVAEKSTVTVVDVARATSAAAPRDQTTTTTTTDKTTQTTTPPASKRSDALITILFGLGAGSVLVGTFLNRITSIKVPGVEIGLGPKVAQKIAARTTPKTSADRAKVEEAYDLALRAASSLRTSPGDDAAIEVLVDQALNTTFDGHVPPP